MALMKTSQPLTSVGDDDAAWVLSGEKLEKLFNMTNFDRDEAVMKFARQLRGMGVDEALRARGAKDGDIVRIGKFEFEFVELRVIPCGSRIPIRSEAFSVGDKPISFRDENGNFVSAADVWNAEKLEELFNTLNPKRKLRFTKGKISKRKPAEVNRLGEHYGKNNSYR